jgi:tetratricopeptide (TPR) repeat protein
MPTYEVAAKSVVYLAAEKEGESAPFAPEQWLSAKPAGAQQPSSARCSLAMAGTDVVLLSQQAVERSWTMALAAGGISAPPDFADGTRESARDSVVRYFGVGERRAAQLVESLKAYPANCEAAEKIGGAGDVQDGLIHLSAELGGMPDSVEKASLLTSRAKRYVELGQFDKALSDMTRSIQIYEKRGMAPIMQLQDRSEIYASLGNFTASDADLLESTKLYAEHLAKSEGVPSAFAAKFVEDVLAYPVTASVARHVDMIGEAQRTIIRDSLDLHAMPDSIRKAARLSARGLQYQRLGHAAAAKADLAESKRMMIAVLGDARV